MSAQKDVPSDQQGMILINVLVIVIMATAVLAIMLAGQDSDLERSRQLRSAAQAMAIARGGELSAIIALRRDLASGSTTDTLGEPWANIADRDVRIGSGRFSFVVADAQARFNINDLALGDAISQDDVQKLAATVGVAPEHIAGLLVFLRAHGPISDLSELRTVGLGDDELRRLAFLCAALPEPTTVNVNTAPEALLAVLTGNPAIAHQIVVARARAGAGGIAGMGNGQFVLPPGAGVSSTYFWTRARVTVGGTTQQLTSLLRRRLADGKPIVEAVRRWRGVAPIGAPDFPEARR
jgi:general secretion pathway protein K